MLNFKPGDRVECRCYDVYSGVPAGSLGTVKEIATIGGKSVYPDPRRILLYVAWDDEYIGEKSIPRKYARKIVRLTRRK